MCGIVGILDLKDGSVEIDRALLSRMNESQFHRGPDEGGLHSEPGIGLGHRRLSIIDLSSGQQPLFNSSGNIGVVYNGEIYNFMQLRQELSGLGYQFKTHCDTEVVVYAWEQWGAECVHRFRGMFAFALWDRNKRSLFLVRDRFGIKPLFYAQLDNGQVIFASELKALQLHPALSKQMDPQAVEDYFAFGYIPEPKTILKQVRKLQPGHSLTLKIGEALPLQQQYWDIALNQPITVEDEQAVAEELIDRLREAVDIRMVADVPLGAFLSGGVDSSAVVAQMAGLSEQAVNTSSIGFSNSAFDESNYASQVAEQFQTRHLMEQVDADDFSLLDRLAGLYDEPYADSSAMPTYRVCALAKRRVTVALSGDGGDELMAGYRRQRWHMNEERVRERMPAGLRASVFGLLGKLYPKLDWAPKVFRAKTTFQAIARGSAEAYMHTVSINSDALRTRLFSARCQSELQGYHASEVFRQYARHAPAEDALSLIQYLDMKTYLPGDILTKVDRASMAHSLEVRVPLLDHELAQWISSLPPELKLRGQEGKYIFKKALEPQLSKDILYRDKMGFSIPLCDWFRGPLKETVKQSLLGERMADSGLFNPTVLTSLVSQHQSGIRDHTTSLWSLLMFDAYLKQHQ